jgi:hypothetical protein
VEVGKFLKGLRPVISPAIVVFFMLRFRPSIIRMNRKGDIGSPCLMPLVGQKGLVRAPFIQSEKLFVETRMIIQLI